MRGNSVDRLAQAIGELIGREVELERPSDSKFGDYATNAALRGGGNPRELAAKYAEQVVALPEVERADVAGPGFVNLTLTDSFFVDAVAEIDTEYGGGSAESPERIQVEMVSANPTGPITVASARNGAYGDSVARLLEFAGHDVSREYYWNDAGKQMDRFRASVDAIRRGEQPPEDGYQGAYVEDLARIEGDPVPVMLEKIVDTLRRFRVDFDSFVREAELEPEIPDAIARIDTYESEGTTWARTSSYGDDKDRPLLRSADESHLYFAADVAYVRHKLERFARAIYVLGADHHGYVGRLKAAAAMLGYDPERVEVLIYQLVHLTSGGEQRKMSKRRGDVVFLDDFMDEIGVDAARWYLVNRGPDQTIEIDVDLAAEKSQKNPVYYVQYAHARIAGILRNAPASPADAAAPLEPLERELVKRLAEFPSIVREATKRRGPQALPVYAIKVADDFHRFYHDVRVLGSDAERFRLDLCRA
ncbi:MAG: arginine--tRNA ligase, partial [Actinobacteria bacterium]|nr:arginine--tRNA ligase [Actinomycetota bacterium]